MSLWKLMLLFSLSCFKYTGTGTKMQIIKGRLPCSVIMTKGLLKLWRWADARFQVVLQVLICVLIWEIFDDETLIKWSNADWNFHDSTITLIIPLKAVHGIAYEKFKGQLTTILIWCQLTFNCMLRYSWSHFNCYLFSTLRMSFFWFSLFFCS